jgi:hypothetical protein
MKIAYIFHGHSRTWNQCYQNFFNNVFSIAPGDIFIHTWDRVNAKSGSHWNGWEEQVSQKLEEESSKILDLGGIIKAYNPKHITVETDTGVDHLKEKYKKQIPNPHLGAKRMLESCLKCFNTAKQHGNYDVYFSTRLDINYLSKLNIEELHSKKLIIPKTVYDGTHPYIFDIWSVGNESQFNIKTKFYDAIDNYWYYATDNFHSYIYEQALKKYYNDNNIETQTSNLQYCAPRIIGEPTFW